MSQLLDVAGFLAGVLLAFRLSSLPAAMWRAFGLSLGWSVLTGLGTIFIPVIVLTAYIGWRAGRITMQPRLNLTNRALGAGLGIVLGATALVFLLFLAPFAPLPSLMVDAVSRSPTARWMLDLGRPTNRVLQTIAGPDAIRLTLYGRQVIASQSGTRVDTTPVAFAVD